MDSWKTHPKKQIVDPLTPDTRWGWYSYLHIIPLYHKNEPCIYGGFLKWWVSPTTMGKLLLKMISTWGVKWGYHHLRKHPYRQYFVNIPYIECLGTRSYHNQHVDGTLRDVAPAAGVAGDHRRCQHFFLDIFCGSRRLTGFLKRNDPKKETFCHGTWETKNENCKLRKKEVTLGLVCRSDMFEGNGCVGYFATAFASLPFNQPPLCVFHPTFDLKTRSWMTWVLFLSWQAYVIYLEPQWPLFLKVNPQNKVFSNQNKGHLGSRYFQNRATTTKNEDIQQEEPRIRTKISLILTGVPPFAEISECKPRQVWHISWL